MTMHWPRRFEARVRRDVSQIARAAWLAFAALAVGLAIPGIPRYYRLLYVPCDGNDCFAAQITSEAARVAVGTGDLRGYAVVQTSIGLLIAIPLVMASASLIWREAHQRLAVLAAFVATAQATDTFAQALAHSDDRFRFPVRCIQFVQLAGLPPLLCLLPDGQFRPRGVRWAALAYVLASTLALMPLARDWFAPGTTGHTLWLVALALVAVLVLANLVYRLRSAADATQRAQLRWVLAAIGLAVPVALTGRSLGLLRSMPLVMELFAASGLWQFTSLLFAFGSFACLLVAYSNVEPDAQASRQSQVECSPVR